MTFLLRTIGVLMLAVFSTAYSEQAEYDQFTQGYYMTKKDEKIEGLVRYIKGKSARAEYKETADSRKVKVLSVLNCKEFGMEGGIRFVKVPKSLMVRVGGLNRVLSQDFVRVFEEGKVNLYKYYTDTESKDIKNLARVDVEIPIIRVGSGNMVPLSGNDSKTQEQLEELFPREPKAIKTFMSGNWDEIVTFVQEYNKKIIQIKIQWEENY